ncbi:nitroreductase family deazaflavin-dependent oxidoreductase [Streptomyces sp. MUM 203J]|uniref:nitroreductase/quinone reductase family protein n=1 Tax=Streptomyces sp. MUM 203J TaxID=2791990 RepID=UPI001F04C5C1|nr:nitroreductase/quinone reductase family protein [Streptomyces sp. MUM 203J]MCH0541212.1 nitroreductase family deazaflavin-dependent oxidoreductase [Streptomyces sp. MUM 203J]
MRDAARPSRTETDRGAAERRSRNCSPALRGPAPASWAKTPARASYEAIASIPQGEERDRLFERVVEVAPGYGDYQVKTTRVIPVVVLHRTGPEPGAERVKGMGDWIVEVHDWLREQLAGLRVQFDALVDGTAESVSVGLPDPGLAEQLRTHCFEFCGALKRHHTGEDAAMFPVLAKQFPGLAPALTELGEQHAVVAGLQDEIGALVEGFVPGESDPARVRTELEELADRLEEHFAYEEQIIVKALNATAPAPVFA